MPIRELIRLYLRFARPHLRLIMLTAAASLAAAFLTGIQPLILAPAVDNTVLSSTPAAKSVSEINLNNLGATLLAVLGLPAGERRLGAVVLVVALYVAVVAATSAIAFAVSHLITHLRVRVARDLQAVMYQRLLSLPMPFFVLRRSGELVNRFQVDAVRTADALDPIARGILESTLQLAIYAVALVRTDAMLALAAGVLGLLHGLITRFLQDEMKQRTLQWMDGFASVGARVQESILAIRIIKSFSAEAFELKRFGQLIERLRSSLVRYSRYASAEMPLRDLANALFIGAAIVTSAAALADGRLTLSGFVLFVVIARQATNPLSRLNAAIVYLYGTAGAAQRVLELLNTTPTMADGVREPFPLSRGLALRGVSFAYDSSARVLHGIELQLPKGSMLALVGPTGAGKSTIADLVLRLHDPVEGRVVWDDVDIREFRQQAYRRRFGVVPQEPLLFNASIEENIVYGRPILPEELARAARLANAAEFIERFPERYQTLVGERGIRLSGGQRQRIAIARAVYGHPEVLILDEATSALDSESERLVREAIDQAVADTTSIVIAHRLSTVLRAQAIAVVCEGRIVACGRHEELLRSTPLYRRLYDAQFSG